MKALIFLFPMRFVPLHLVKIWMRYEHICYFCTHILHFSPWEKITLQFCDRIRDQIDWGYPVGCFSDVKKISPLEKF